MSAIVLKLYGKSRKTMRTKVSYLLDVNVKTHSGGLIKGDTMKENKIYHIFVELDKDNVFFARRGQWGMPNAYKLNPKRKKTLQKLFRNDTKRTSIRIDLNSVSWWAI